MLKGQPYVAFTFDPSAKIDFKRGTDFGNCFQRGYVHNVFGFCAVKVYHMQAAEAHVNELPGYIRWTFSVHLFAVIISLCQSYALSLYEVYGGYQFYVHSSKKFLSIASPTFPLFSGWNWQA